MDQLMNVFIELEAATQKLAKEYNTTVSTIKLT